MLAIISLHGGLKVAQLIVDLLIYRYIDLCRRCPKHYNTIAAFIGLELSDVIAQGLHHLPTAQVLLNIVAIKSLGIVLVEGSLHRHNLLQLIAHRIDILLLEHLGIHRCLIGVLGIDIPTAKHDVIELGQRHNIRIMQILGIGTTANTHLVVLGHRTYRLGETFTSHQHTCHKRSRNGSTANYQDSQFALGGLNS